MRRSNNTTSISFKWPTDTSTIITTRRVVPSSTSLSPPSSTKEETLETQSVNLSDGSREITSHVQPSTTTKTLEGRALGDEPLPSAGADDPTTSESAVPLTAQDDDSPTPPSPASVQNVTATTTPAVHLAAQKNESAPGPSASDGKSTKTAVAASEPAVSSDEPEDNSRPSAPSASTVPLDVPGDNSTPLAPSPASVENETAAAISAEHPAIQDNESPTDLSASEEKSTIAVVASSEPAVYLAAQDNESALAPSEKPMAPTNSALSIAALQVEHLLAAAVATSKT